jgi:hypothetical protein
LEGKEDIQRGRGLNNATCICSKIKKYPQNNEKRKSV